MTTPAPLEHSQRSPLPRRLSPAAIDRYRACPHTAYLQFVARVSAAHVVTPARTVGNAVHEALERFFARDPTDRSRSTMDADLLAAWAGQPRDLAFASAEEDNYYLRQALDQVHGLIEHFDCSGRPWARERWVEAPLANGTIVYGKVDRLDLRSTGSRPVFELVDYKTGGFALNNDDLPDDSAARVYLLGVEHATDAVVHRVRFLYLASGQEARWEVEREDVEAARTSLDQLTREMHTDGRYEPSPGRACGLCPFRASCHAVQPDIRFDSGQVVDRSAVARRAA